MVVGGAALAVAGAVTVLGEHAGDPLVVALFYAFVDVGLAAGAVAAAYFLLRSNLSPADLRHVTGWYVGGVLALWVLLLWASAPAIGRPGWLADLTGELVLFGNLGGALGAVAGVNRARARQNRRLVEQTAAQQETLTFLNHLLRHNVLNGLQVIDGYRSLLEEHVDDEGRDHLTRIQRRSEHMTELVENVRSLTRTLSETDEPRPVDLSAALRTELEVAREAFPEATFEADVPDGVVVAANPTLGAVFDNLLTNAVVHSDRDDPTVECRLRAEGDRAVVTVADDGPGVPAEYREVVRGGERDPEAAGDGLGLYLVATLVEQFGGAVAIRDREPRGTAVEVELPLADR